MKHFNTIEVPLLRDMTSYFTLFGECSCFVNLVKQRAIICRKFQKQLQIFWQKLKKVCTKKYFSIFAITSWTKVLLFQKSPFTAGSQNTPFLKRIWSSNHQILSECIYRNKIKLKWKNIFFNVTWICCRSSLTQKIWKEHNLERISEIWKKICSYQKTLIRLKLH